MLYTVKRRNLNTKNYITQNYYQHTSACSTQQTVKSRQCSQGIHIFIFTRLAVIITRPIYATNERELILFFCCNWYRQGKQCKLPTT